MISGHDLQAFLVQPAGRLDDGARLHLGDFGIGDAEPDAAMAEHRVELVELLDAVQQPPLLLELRAALAGRSRAARSPPSALRASGRNSWSGGSMVRIVTGVPVHRLEDAVEVVALQRQQLVERLAAIGLVVGQDHPLHDRDAALAEEHVLGAAQADAARAERVGELRLIRQIGVRADAQPPELVGPRQQLLEPLIDVRLLRRRASR